MFMVLAPADDSTLARPLTSPLSSVEIGDVQVDVETGSDTGSAGARPLALRELRPAPWREVPAYVYDPVRQVAVALDGRPLAPELKKDWTTIEGTHTDGDGGDNELWDWEEVR